MCSYRPAAPPGLTLDEDRHARLALNHAVEPADPQIGRLLALHSPAEVLAAIQADQLPDLDPDPARRNRLADRCAGLRLRLEPGRVEAGMATAEAVGARFITSSDAEWPARLDDLGELRPIGIWAIGSGRDVAAAELGASPSRTSDGAADCCQPSDPQPPSPSQSPSSPPPKSELSHGRVATLTADAISVVGARACSGYGAYVAGALGADLASAGTTVISGAALGIDAAAHRGALAAAGPTIAVLACGIDRIYPRAHEALLRAIAGHGAVLTELPPGAEPTRFRFLHRNRLIAALGAGTVVVEAARRSGSLVTARLAADLGRVVMAVPGPVTSDQSAGANELIRDGAILVAHAAQVREACVGLAAAARALSETPTARAAVIRRAGRERRARPQSADPVEELVLQALPGATANAGADVLALARATGVGPDAVFAALGRLAACGQASKAGGGWTLSAKG